MKHNRGRLIGLLVTLAIVAAPIAVAAPAHAIDQPIGQATWQNPGNGCKVRVEGRNNAFGPVYLGNDPTPRTVNGPSFSFAILDDHNAGWTCSGIRVNWIFECPTLFIGWTWALSQPEKVEQIVSGVVIPGGRTFVIPLFGPSYPTCRFVGMWLEMNSSGWNPKICVVYTVVSGWGGDPCGGPHGTGTQYENPFTWYYTPF